MPLLRRLTWPCRRLRHCALRRWCPARRLWRSSRRWGFCFCCVVLAVEQQRCLQRAVPAPASRRVPPARRLSPTLHACTCACRLVRAGREQGASRGAHPARRGGRRRPARLCAVHRQRSLGCAACCARCARCGCLPDRMPSAPCSTAGSLCCPPRLPQPPSQHCAARPTSHLPPSLPSTSHLPPPSPRCRADEDMFAAMESLQFSPHMPVEVFACTVGQKPSKVGGAGQRVSVGRA